MEIVENIDAISDFLSGMDFNTYTASRRTRYAVTRALEIISGATRRLPGEIKSKYPQIDWQEIAAAGNVYRHEYEDVDDRLIWETAKHGLERLDEAAKAELRCLGSTEFPDSD